MTTFTVKAIFRCGSAIALLWAVYLHWRVRSIATWPKVSGVIREAEISSDVDNDSEPKISYTFDYRGKNYASTQVSPTGTLSTSGRYAADIVAKYPVGTSVTVYVNPENPKDSVLERSMPSLVYILLYAAVLSFGIAPAFF